LNAIVKIAPSFRFRALLDALRRPGVLACGLGWTILLGALLLMSAGAGESAGAADTAAAAPLTNIAQAISLTRELAQTPRMVSLSAWVLGVDRELGSVSIRDSTGGWEFASPRLAAELQEGSQILVMGRTGWAEGRVVLNMSEVRVVEPAPEPKRLGLGEQAGSNRDMAWAEVEGEVGFIGESGPDVLVEIGHQDRRLSATIPRVHMSEAAGLLHRKVHMRGVAQRGFSSGGRMIYTRMWVSGLGAIHLVEPSVQDWGGACRVAPGALAHATLDRFGLFGNQGLSGVNFNLSAGSLVWVSGRLRKTAEPGFWELGDDSGWVLVDLPAECSLAEGQSVDLLGILTGHGSQPALFCGCFRPLAAGGDLLPVLTTVAQVHRLKPAEAERGYPVRIRGVATGGFGYIQDETRGISVSNALNRMVFGGFYQIEGTTGSGWYAPVVCPARITYLGAGQLPEPIHPGWEQLATGSVVCQWLELQGLAVAVGSNHLVLAIPGGRVEAEIQGNSKLGSLENSIVRIRGTCRSEYNARRQLTRFWVDVPSASFISVESSVRKDPFEVGERSLAEILQFDVDAYQVRRIKVRGQVAYHAGQVGYLTDGTNGLKYSLKSAAGPQPGDSVEMVGVPMSGGYAPVLGEAVWRAHGHAGLASAPEVKVAELALGERNATRIRVKGRVLAATQDPVEGGLALLVESQVVGARVRLAADSPQPFAEVGSVVELTGICAGLRSRDAFAGRTNAFELLVQSPTDLVVRQRPSWWTFKHSAQIMGVLGAGLLAAFSWIYLLRTKVNERTQQLKTQMLETQRSERQRVVELERSRIARDLHDNLGACLTEISMLSETGHLPGMDEGASKQRFGQIRNRAHTLVRTLDETVWAVDPEMDSLPSLVRYLAAYAEEFVTASGVTCRVDVPAQIPARVLTAELRHDLFLAAKEALNNAVRHAGANTILFQIDLVQPEIQIQVVDDGQGFELGQVSTRHGVGNLRARMSGSGRRCSIVSSPGKGTTVLLAVTLPPSEDGRAL
jgi:signal transduction histidine kinase